MLVPFPPSPSASLDPLRGGDSGEGEKAFGFRVYRGTIRSFGFRVYRGTSLIRSFGFRVYRGDLCVRYMFLNASRGGAISIH